jgi:hypothetical protein
MVRLESELGQALVHECSELMRAGPAATDARPAGGGYKGQERRPVAGTGESLHVDKWWRWLG